MARKVAAEEAVAVSAGDLVIATEQTPVAIFTNADAFDVFYHDMKDKAEEEVKDADVNTVKGREAIRSMAYKVSRTKTALEATALKLTEEARQQVAKVNEARNRIKAQLDTLRDSIREPLTKWEEAEEERAKIINDQIDWLRGARVLTEDDTPETVSARHQEVAAFRADPLIFLERVAEAALAQESALDVLANHHARMLKEIADREELERLRAERDERDRIERERIEQEEERQREEDRRREEEETERRNREAEAERIRNAEATAAAEAEAKARAKAEAEAAEKDAAHRAEIARLEQEAETNRRAEAKRLADEKAEADAKKAREEDLAHKTAVLSRIKTAIMKCGVEEHTAKTIVLAILAGQISNCRIEY